MNKNRIKEYFDNEGYQMLFSEIARLEGQEKVKALTNLLSFAMPKATAQDDGTPKYYGAINIYFKDQDNLPSNESDIIDFLEQENERPI